MSGRSLARARITRLLSSGARAAIREARPGVVPSALTTHASEDCGGAAGGRGTHGAALVLTCHERQRRRSQPSTTLSRRLRAESSCTMFTGDGRGDGAGVQSEGAVSRAWRRGGGVLC